MVQESNGTVFQVSDCEMKGFFSKKFILTLTDQSGHTLKFIPSKFLDVQKNSTATGLAIASTSGSFRKKVGDNYFPADFWNSIPEDKLATMLPQEWA
jgi:hypothetical protein